MGQVFSEYFAFSCHSFHQLIYIHHLPSGASTIDQIVADIPSGLSLAPPEKIVLWRSVKIPFLLKMSRCLKSAHFQVVFLTFKMQCTDCGILISILYCNHCATFQVPDIVNFLIYVPTQNIFNVSCPCIGS
jgi:hypothetical protein